MVRRSGSYAEVTPSGEGIRIIGLGSGELVHRKPSVPNANGASCELYRRATRYITVTGNQIGDAAALVKLDALFDETLAELNGTKQQTTKGAGQGEQREHDLESLIKNGCGDDFGCDRSRAVWYVINQLLNQGRAGEDIIAVLLDRSNGISEHIYDKSKPEEYARRQVENAQQERAADSNVEIVRLANLSLLDYEHERDGAAERLNVRTTILDRLVRS